MTIFELFNRVLSAPYIHISEDGDYCTERDGDTLYIYFQWTHSKIDWLNNFDFPAKPYRDMTDKWYCHRGFLRVWKSCEEHLKAEIMDETVRNIIIAGYSHGAAIAALCTEYVAYNRPDVCHIGYGFGCPRVVWGFLRKAVKERFNGFYVIRNGKDIVTHLPPAIFGFRHVGELIKIGNPNKYGMIKAHYPELYQKEILLWMKTKS